MEERRVIFISAVSDEFHRVPPDRRHTFSSYRDVLKHAFRTLAPHYEIIVQEDLVQGLGDLLETLDDEVSRSLIIVHLVGELAGYVPEPACTTSLHRRHPDFLFTVPELRQAFGNETTISYTQWEIYLAFHHQKYRLIFEALPSAPRSPLCMPTVSDQASQSLHRRRLTLSGAHRGKIADQGDLARKVVRSFLHFRMDPRLDSVEPNEELVAEAWSNRKTIIQELVRAMRKPDPRKVPVSDPANVAAFIAAVRASAESWEVNLATIITIAAHHEAEVRAVAEERPTSEALYDQALAEIALGDLTAAQHSARRAANYALRLRGDEPRDSDLHRKSAINALLLFHDAAVAAHAIASAIAALEEAGSLVEKEREPLLWVEVHEPLARFLLAHARYDRAEELIDDIVDIREEHQGDTHKDFAVALLLWAELLFRRAKFPGAESVAIRAERIFAHQELPEIFGAAAALTLQGCSLLEEERIGEAEPLLRRVVAIDEEFYEGEHLNVAASLNNLAELLGQSSRVEEAERLTRRAIAIAERTAGADDPITATYCSNLSRLLIETNDLREAEVFARRSTAIHEQVLGPEHPTVGIDLQILGAILKKSSSFIEAEAVLRRALTISEKNGGPENPEYVNNLGWLALLLQELDRFVEAEQLMRRCLTLGEEFWGVGHFNTCASLYNLAGLLSSTNRQTEAEPLMRRAVEIVLEFLKTNERPHPEWKRVLERYANILLMCGMSREEVQNRINQLAESLGCRIHFRQ